MKAASGENLSIWSAAADRQERSPLRRNEDADVCIVGAGIAGMSTAYRLAAAGRSVIVIDDGAIASGETRHTSAHLVNEIGRAHV